MLAVEGSYGNEWDKKREIFEYFPLGKGSKVGNVAYG